MSLYHHVTKEEYGAETMPTYFHRRREAEGFHIDYCFVHHDLAQRVRSFNVGTYDDYVARTTTAGLSDHVPLIVDFDLS